MLPSLFEISVIKADTIRMMQYNLMYYTTSVPSDCDGSGDYLNNKDSALKAIVHYVQPDVLCVNEIGSQSSYVSRILNNALNTDGINYFANCPLTNFREAPSQICCITTPENLLLTAISILLHLIGILMPTDCTINLRN
jgi:hypothetical protein